jgi:surface polysaccharide O-acyltransferase-like enzyme
VSAAAPGRTRLPGLDALKGIAIAGVIAIHASPASPADDSAWYRYVTSGVARLAVPLFLLITGYLIGLRRPPREKLVATGWKFLRLHLIYSAFYWALEPLAVGAWRELTLKNALMHFAPFSFPGQFYLFILPQVYFVFGFLVPERLRASTGVLAASLALALATVAFLAASIAAGHSAPLPWMLVGHSEATPLVWLFAVAAGIWVGARADNPRFARVGALPSLALAALAALLAACDWPPTDGPDYLRHFGYARWSLLIGTALLAPCLPWAARALWLPGLEALGRQSFGVFVFNPLILGLLSHNVGHIETLSQSAAYAAVMLAGAYGLARWLRPRLPFAFP